VSLGISGATVDDVSEVRRTACVVANGPIETTPKKTARAALEIAAGRRPPAAADEHFGQLGLSGKFAALGESGPCFVLVGML